MNRESKVKIYKTSLYKNHHGLQEKREQTIKLNKERDKNFRNEGT